jgi:hypothetical protein
MYVVEAGVSAGAADLAQVATNGPTLSLVATGVAAGAYYVRVRAANGAGVGPASDEVLAVVGGGPGPNAPAALGAPVNLTATAAGGNVTLRWHAASGSPASYVIEAGSSAGARDLANVSTGSTATEFQTSGVGAGVYYVRVRAMNTNGVSAASNEVKLVVGNHAAASCGAAPPAPGSLAASVAGSTVTLVWGTAAGQPTAYVLEAGSRPGAADLATTDLTGTSMTATAVGPGMYFVRVRAKNACGTSRPSDEIIVTVR